MIVKFLERMYRDVPQFAKMATQPEFVESLVATLFPPIGKWIILIVGLSIMQLHMFIFTSE